MMSYFASVYVRMILWLPVKDTTAGFICYHSKVLETIRLDNIKFKGYAFQICMKYAAFKHRFKLAEVPIVFIDRAFGESFVSRIEESITQDYNDYWKSFTIYFKDTCVDDLFRGNMPFHHLFDRYVLYTDTDYWDVHLIKVTPKLYAKL
jgi:hypothetical protein